MAKMGRPKKKFNRRSVTMFINESLLAEIDEHVAKTKSTVSRDYTRSDFFNDAAKTMLKKLNNEKRGYNDRQIKQI